MSTLSALYFNDRICDYLLVVDCFSVRLELPPLLIHPSTDSLLPVLGSTLLVKSDGSLFLEWSHLFSLIIQILAIL